MAVSCFCVLTFLFPQRVVAELSDSGTDNIPVVQLAGVANKPVIYLTFDDGPSSDDVTERLLDILAIYNARATFFVTGARARAAPGKIRQIVEAGHALGNHTLSHAVLPSLFEHEVIEELSATNSYVLAAGGPVLKCFRAPFGLIDRQVVDIASSMGLVPSGWTVDTRDWDIYVDSEQINTRLNTSVHKSVVLMHDGPVNRWKTLEAFNNWMTAAAHNYRFESLPACVESGANTFAAAKPPPPELPPKILNIEELLAKLRSYEIALLPDDFATHKADAEGITALLETEK